MWTSNEAFDITTLTNINKRSILLGDVTLDLNKWFK